MRVFYNENDYRLLNIACQGRAEVNLAVTVCSRKGTLDGCHLLVQRCSMISVLFAIFNLSQNDYLKKVCIITKKKSQSLELVENWQFFSSKAVAFVSMNIWVGSPPTRSLARGAAAGSPHVILVVKRTVQKNSPKASSVVPATWEQPGNKRVPWAWLLPAHIISLHKPAEWH